MDTELLRADDPAAMARAAAELRAGGLVAFPTETVYGLGANALDAVAVGRIFAAKGRPANNPVIVHVADIAGAQEVVAAWPAVAQQLAERFWPGPLTLVLPRGPAVPDAVTASGPTVAVRVPAHPTAQALLRVAGVPIAAPSANRSSELSPTTAAHVLAGLAGRVAIVLDGGPCPGGLESTVLDLTTSPPRLLRPGLVTPTELEEAIGPVQRSVNLSAADQPLPSPGLLPKHYAPRTPLECVEGSGTARAEELARKGLRIGRVMRGARMESRGEVAILPADPSEYAAHLYAELHRLDRLGLDAIVVDLPPEADEWLAVRDRLRRAATR